MNKCKKQPCTSCRALVPDNQLYPYPGHRKSCALVKEWKSKYEGLFVQPIDKNVKLRIAELETEVRTLKEALDDIIKIGTGNPENYEQVVFNMLKIAREILR